MRNCLPLSVQKLTALALSLLLTVLLTACSTLSVSVSPTRAEGRLFLNLSLEFLGEYKLAKQTWQGTAVGGLSALTYDRQKDRFYAISDDRSQLAPARFYTLQLSLAPATNGQVKLPKVAVEGVTFLKNERGETYPPGTIDGEGIALSPRQTVFMASEGSVQGGINPFIGEFDLKTGQLQQYLPIPERYLPKPPAQAGDEPIGIQNNLAFEALTVEANSLIKDDPFRLFTATESSLSQDGPPKTAEEKAPLRLLHYVINPIGPPVLVAEHLYLLEPSTSETIANGLSEILALEKEGYFLSLERTLGLSGFGAKIFEVVNANATDTSRILSFRGNLDQIQPLKKRLLFDLKELNITLENLEGMSFGPRLADGSQTLILVSDDNFSESQATQFLLFRLVEKS
jgi:hypothetical protein